MSVDHNEIAYQWIIPDQIPDLAGKRIVLFGAGKGAEEFLHFVAKIGTALSILAVADNDRSFWGVEWRSFPVVPPAELANLDFDRVIISSVSGREVIAAQLQAFGVDEAKITPIGRYPLSHHTNYSSLLSRCGHNVSFLDTTCLTVGPGGFLGFEALLYCLGAKKVCAVDKHSFAMAYPCVDARWADYLEVRKFLEGLQDSGGCSRFPDLFMSDGNGGRLMIRDKIEYLFPVDVEAMPLSDGSFDRVISFAVLEHVRNPEKAVAEIARVLTPGGICIHRIVTQDHRSFSSVGTHSPFSFRHYSAGEWNDVVADKFYQNRLLPVEWQHLHRQHGLRLVDFQVERSEDLTDDEAALFAPEFQRFSRAELAAVNCWVVAEKMGDWRP